METAQMEILAPDSGRLRILAQPENIIRLGDVLGRIETD
jgi:biotin carboxyl carrier protein